MPTDELDTAESTLAVLRTVLHGVGRNDASKPTPCREFNIAQLTDHLMNSITTIGGAAGAKFPKRVANATVETQVMEATRPALQAWHKRGLDGTVAFGEIQVPAKTFVGVLSVEFLIHAWDYATATGQRVQPPDDVADYVLGIARQVITDRPGAGFDEPVPVSDTAPVFDRLIAFTGRHPAG